MGKARKERRGKVGLAKEKTVSAMWEAIIWVVFAASISFGGINMSHTPPDYAAARICFSIAALILFLRLGWWIKCKYSLKDKRFWVSILADFIIVMVMWLCCFHWVSNSEHRFQTIHASKKESKTPTFGGYLKDALVTGSENGYRLIIVTGEIKNSSGPSSSITDWKMFLRFPDGTNIEGEDVLISDRDKLLHFKGRVDNNFLLKREKYLPDRGIDSLKEGDAIDGWFCKKFTDDDISNAQEKKAVVIVTFSDAWDKIHSYQINMPGKNDTNFPKSF